MCWHDSIITKVLKCPETFFSLSFCEYNEAKRKSMFKIANLAIRCSNKDLPFNDCNWLGRKVNYTPLLPKMG